MRLVRRAHHLAEALFLLLPACLSTASDVTAAASAVAFIENRGQLPAEVLYYAPGSPVSAYLTRDALVLDLNSGGEAGVRRGAGHVIRLRFDGADARAAFEARGSCGARFNYICGDRAEGHHANVPSYDEVIASDLWPGIDVAFRIDADGIAYELIPRNCGRDGLARARFVWEGIDEVGPEIDGARILTTSAGLLSDRPPTAGRSGQVARVTDSTAAREQDDPGTLLWSTFLGGSSDESAWDVALDSAGNVVVTGLTISTFFPTTVGAYDETYNGFGDVFVSKLDPSGSTLLWSTFLGGNELLLDYGQSVVLDLDDNVILAGYASSPNFPTTSGAYDEEHNGKADVFVAKLDPSGSTLLWSTFVGGAENDIGYSVAIDQTQNVVVGGRTLSGDFPIAGAAYDPSSNGEEDAFVLKLAIDGSALLWSTYLGGQLYDSAAEIAVGSGGRIVVVGATGSFDFPVTSGAFSELHSGGIYDGFLCELSGAGDALSWGTFLGSTGDFDLINTVVLDDAGRPVVAGVTSGADFPATAGAYDTSHNGFDDAFVAKLAVDGSDVVWSTFLGGSEFGFETAFGLGLDALGDVVVAGATPSADFPTTAEAFDTSFNGYIDAYVSKLSGDGSALLWSSYLGGAESDQVYALALDEAGSPVVVGATGSPAFPVTPGAFDEEFGGGDEEVFVAKFAIPDSPTPIFLASFDARSSEAGVELRWATASEFDLLGFHVYRSEDRGAWHRITNEFVTGDSRLYRFVDAGVESGRAYIYEIEAVDNSGASARYGPVEITALTPDRLSLRCEPNPIAANATVRFSLPESGRVRIDLYSADGRRVDRLVDADFRAGFQSVDWSGKAAGNGALSAGVYYLRIQAAGGAATERITLLR